MEIKELIEREIVGLIVYGLVNEHDSKDFINVYNCTLEDYESVMDEKVIYA